MKNLFFLLLLLVTQICSGQDNSQNEDSGYYDNWSGEWYEEVNGKLNELPSFVVKQSLYKSSFEETWIGKGGNFSKAWRAWDDRTKKWNFAWMSVDGLFQIWEGKKTDNIWFMCKTFVLDDGQEVLSRQAFIPQNKYTLIRTSEHSKDKGKTWKLRFKEKYVKK